MFGSHKAKNMSISFLLSQELKVQGVSREEQLCKERLASMKRSTRPERARRTGENDDNEAATWRDADEAGYLKRSWGKQ